MVACSADGSSLQACRLSQRVEYSRGGCMHGRGARGEHGKEWERLRGTRLGPVRRHTPCCSTVQLASRRAHYCAGDGIECLLKTRRTQWPAVGVMWMPEHGADGRRLQVRRRKRTRRPVRRPVLLRCRLNCPRRNVAPLTGPLHWAARLSSALRAQTADLKASHPCLGARSRVSSSSQRVRHGKRTSQHLTAMLTRAPHQRACGQRGRRRNCQYGLPVYWTVDPRRKATTAIDALADRA
jgi:hypothetical protein